MPADGEFRSEEWDRQLHCLDARSCTSVSAGWHWERCSPVVALPAGEDAGRSDRGEGRRTERLVRHLLQVIESRDTATIWSLFADDGVIEFPFIGLRVTDLASLDATIGQALAVLDGLTFFDLVFEPMADPNAVIVKHKGHAVVSFTGKPYDQMYINEVHVRDGKVASFVEYYDTAVFNEAFTP